MRLLRGGKALWGYDDVHNATASLGEGYGNGGVRSCSLLFLLDDGFSWALDGGESTPSVLEWSALYESTLVDDESIPRAIEESEEVWW